MTPISRDASSLGSDPRPSDRHQKTYLNGIPIVLLLIAIASAAYLSVLYLKIHGPAGGAEVDAFCNIGKRFNCTKVSASKYATLWGVPNAFLALQYYIIGLALYIVLRKQTFAKAILLLYMLIGLPNILYLAYMSVTALKTVCLMCAVLYVCHSACVLLLAFNISRRSKLIGQLTSSIADIFAQPKIVIALSLTAIVTVSQFFWMPQILSAKGFTGSSAGHIATHPNTPGASVHTVKIDHDRLRVSGTSIGNPDATLQVIGYSDFQCPLCKKAHVPLFEIIQEYPEKIHFTHKDFPLDEKCNRQITGSFHDQACVAAFFTRCALTFDRFFEVGASLFHSQHTISSEYLASVASAYDLSPDNMQNCMAQSSIKESIEEDIESGLELGLKGTPTFIVNGKTIVGAKDKDWWMSAINGNVIDK